MSRWLRYLKYSLIAPKWRDYYDMGLGIEARAERLQSEWGDHFSRTKDFQAKILKQVSFHGCIAVLGAGRCYDLNLSALKDHSTITLCYDLDRTALATAKRALSTFNARFECLDLTASIAEWSNKLQQVRTGDQLVKMLEQLEPKEVGSIGLESCDCSLSLNLLGQIPLYWRDRVAAAAKRIAQLEADWRGNFKEPLHSALTNSMRKLQEQHLKLLEVTAKQIVILISDAELIYTTDNKQIHSESALYVNPENYFKDNWQLIESEQWLWNIAPQSIEIAEYGCQHLIKAWAWQRTNA